MATPLVKTFTFSPGTKIVSAQVNADLNQLFNALTGTDLASTIMLGGTNLPSNYASGLAFAPFFVDGQALFSSNANGAVIRVFKRGDDDARIELLTSGEIRTKAGNQAATPTDQTMYLSGCIFNSSSDVGNVGAGEDTLKSFDILANVFSGGGTRGAVHVFAGGRTAANANNKQIKFKVIGTNVIASGAVAFNNLPWFLDVWIIPDSDSVSTVTVVSRFVCGATDVRDNIQVAGFDFTVDNTCLLTGEAVADNDIYVNFINVTKHAGGAI